MSGQRTREREERGGRKKNKKGVDGEEREERRSSRKLKGESTFVSTGRQDTRREWKRES